jgi:DNA-binding NarL/FixJ family response regulator
MFVSIFNWISYTVCPLNFLGCMKKLRLAIADDHHILLDGLKALLQKQKDMEVVGFFDNGQQIFDALADLPEIDVVIADINMPGLNGHELTLKIKKTYPTIPVIILSMHDDSGHIMEMIDAGVSGYLLKNANNTDLLQAIRNVAGGRMAFSPEVSDKIASFIKHQQDRKQLPEQPRLTDREIEILKLIAQEHSNAKIAEILFISERTVETHRKNMMRKTNNKTIVGLLKYAMDQKIV